MTKQDSWSIGVIRAIAVAAIAVLGRAESVHSEPAEEPTQTPPSAKTSESEESNSESSWPDREKLTGDWGGTRTSLEEAGFTFDMTFTTYYLHVAHGGLKTRNAHTIIGVNDFELTFDLGTMKAVEGGSIYVWGSNAWGESPSSRGWVGDLFWVNGAEVGDRPIDIHELSYEQKWFEDTLAVRLGKVCMSCYFDTNEFAWYPSDDFQNYGLNNAPNIPFPGFAFGTLGAIVTYTPCAAFYIQAGITDADAEFNETGFKTAFHGPDDVLSMYEAGWTPTFETSRGKLPGHYRFGAWHDSQRKERFYDDLGGRRRTVPVKRGDWGVYANFDQVVTRENPEVEDDEQGLGMFFRYSLAEGDVNFIEHFWSIGFQYEGLIPTRDADVLGFGVAQGIITGDVRLYRESPHRETALETYYSFQAYPWMTISPDFQWILRPGGLDGPDAFVAGLRMRIVF